MGVQFQDTGLHICPQALALQMNKSNPKAGQITKMVEVNTRNNNGVPLLAKQWVHSEKCAFDSDCYKSFKEVGKVWERVCHPNIAWQRAQASAICNTCPGAQQTSPVAFVELYEQGNVRDLLKKGSLPLAKRLQLIRDVAAGLAYLHGCSLPIYHGRLSPKNVLISDKGRAVISDYGLTGFYNIIETVWKEHYGVDMAHLWSSTYTAPEIIRSLDDGKHEKSGNASEAGDIFSFASLAYEILTGIRPRFRMMVMVNGQAKIITPKHAHMQVDAVLHGITPAWQDEEGRMLTSAPPSLLRWIEGRWNKNPKGRGCMQELVGELDEIIRSIRTGN